MNADINNKFVETRKLFPHAGNIIYFNSASYGPFCRPVVDAINANIDIRMRADYDDSHDAFAVRESLRERYANLIGANRDEVGISMNTSFGLNIAAFGLPLEKGDEVLIFDKEFPALVYTFKAAAEERGLKITYLKSENNILPIETIESAITEKTKVIAISFVQFFNGYKNDLKAISDICKKHNIYFVVDGIQGCGVEPIDVHELGIDIFASGCQKWLLSPQGCGFFYIKKELQEKLRTPFMSWLGVDWEMQFSDLFKFEQPYFESAQKFELGYYAVLNLLGMNASLDIFENLGVENIQSHNYKLIDKIADYFKSSDFYSVTSNLEEKHRSSILTFSCENYRDVQKYLLDNKVILVPREGSIRVSVHLYNNDDDIEKFITLLDAYPQK